MTKRTVVIAAVAIVAIGVAFIPFGENGSLWAQIFGGEPQAVTLTDPDSGKPITLEAVQEEAEWRKETVEKLREVK